MRYFTLGPVFASLLIGMTALPDAAPAQTHSPFLAMGPATAPPVGFVEMCRDGGIMCQRADQAGIAPGTVGEPISTGAIVSSDFPSTTHDCMTNSGSIWTRPAAEVTSEIWTARLHSLSVTSADKLPAHESQPTRCDRTATTPWYAGLLVHPSPTPARLDQTVANRPDFDRVVLKLHRLDAGSDEYVREFRQIQRINRMVNGRVHQQTDNDLYGLADYWVRAGMGNNARGDCEDIAIEKRFQLLKAGFAPERLSFAVAYQAEIGLHTVLVARTDHGDLVLDSRNDALRQWDSTPYRWLSVQDFNAPAIWHTVASL